MSSKTDVWKNFRKNNKSDTKENTFIFTDACSCKKQRGLLEICETLKHIHPKSHALAKQCLDNCANSILV